MNQKVHIRTFTNNSSKKRNYEVETYHSCSLAVAYVWIQPGKTPQHTTKARDPSAADMAETSMAGHGPKQVLGNKDNNDSINNHKNDQQLL